MKQLWLLLGIIVVMTPSALEAATSTGYSYSLSIAKHPVVVTILPNGKTWLVVDGKECKKDRLGQPRAEFGKVHIVLLKKERSLCFWVGDGDEVKVEVGPRKSMQPAPRNAKKIRIGKRTASREKYTSGDIYSPAVNYEFKYQLPSAELVYQVIQTTGAGETTKEFRDAVETLKPREPNTKQREAK